MSYEDIIKESKYKAFGYKRIYYVRITDNSGCNPKLLYPTLKAIERKLSAKHIGVISKGHGRFNRPHIHALLLADNKADLQELLKLIPKGYGFKLWRIRTFSDLQSSKRYIKEHIGKKKRGFLLNLEILALRILIRLWAILSMLRLLKIKLSLRDTYQAHQRALLEKLKEVIFWIG